MILKIFRKIYEGVLSILSETLDKIQNVYIWFKDQKEKAKEYKADMDNYMKTGELDQVKYGVSEEAKLERFWRQYNLHNEFEHSEELVVENVNDLWEKFYEKYKDDMEIIIIPTNKPKYFSWNELEFIPVPNGYAFKHFMSGKIVNYISRKEREEIFNQIKWNGGYIPHYKSPLHAVFQGWFGNKNNEIVNGEDLKLNKPNELTIDKIVDYEYPVFRTWRFHDQNLNQEGNETQKIEKKKRKVS